MRILGGLLALGLLLVFLFFSNTATEGVEEKLAMNEAQVTLLKSWVGHEVKIDGHVLGKLVAYNVETGYCVIERELEEGVSERTVAYFTRVVFCVNAPQSLWPLPPH